MVLCIIRLLDIVLKADCTHVELEVSTSLATNTYTLQCHSRTRNYNWLKQVYLLFYKILWLKRQHAIRLKQRGSDRIFCREKYLSPNQEFSFIFQNICQNNLFSHIQFCVGLPEHRRGACTKSAIFNKIPAFFSISHCISSTIELLINHHFSFLAVNFCDGRTDGRYTNTGTVALNDFYECKSQLTRELTCPPGITFNTGNPRCSP